MAKAKSIEIPTTFQPKPTYRKFIDLEGRTLGRWTVLGFMGTVLGHRFWCCKCSCGTVRRVSGSSLLHPKEPSTSCGCFRNEVFLSYRVKHGMAASPEYAIWTGIISRTTQSSIKQWHRYGGRGIIMCDRWRHDFPAFLASVGKRPTPKHSIERKDNDLGYTCGECEHCKLNIWPMNCRWATCKEQSRNTRRNRFVTFNGITATIPEWSERTGISPSTIYQRLFKLKWPIEEALSQSVSFCNRKHR